MNDRVPFYKQDTNYTCGPTSLQMVFSFLGIFKSEADLMKDACTTKNNGTEHADMIRVATKAGFFCYVNENSTIIEIQRFIGLDLPVIVNFIEPSSNEPHYAVIVSFYSGGILLHDPWNGKGFELKEEDFLSRWYDNHNKSFRWMMVLSRENFELGRQYLPRS